MPPHARRIAIAPFTLFPAGRPAMPTVGIGVISEGHADYYHQRPRKAAVSDTSAFFTEFDYQSLAVAHSCTIRPSLATGLPGPLINVTFTSASKVVLVDDSYGFGAFTQTYCMPLLLSTLAMRADARD